MCKLSVSKGLILYLFLSAFLSGEWIHYDLMGTRILYLLAAVILVLTFKEISAQEWKFGWPTESFKPSNVFWAIASLSPLVFYLILTWRDEFLFGGDNAYHVHVAETYFHFIERIPRVYLILGGFFGFLVCFVLRKRLRRIAVHPVWFGILLILLYAGSYYLSFAEIQMRRYPNLFYVITLPWQGMATVFSWNEPYNAIRVSNFSAIVVWLCLLRPVFVRRYPDFRVFSFAILFYWVWPSLYYFTGYYLEPWSVVMLSVAIELLMSPNEEKKSLAFVFAGASAQFKEVGIFFLPFLGCGILGSAKLREFTLKKIVSTFVIAYVSAIPFLLYYFHRTSDGTPRGFSLAGLEYLLMPDRLTEYLFRLDGFFTGIPLSILMSLFVLATLVTVTKFQREDRIVGVILGAATLFYFLFFYMDTNSLEFTGYSRFQLYWFLFFSWTFVFVLEKVDRITLRWGMVSLIVILNGIGLFKFYQKAVLPNFHRNFLEHYDAAMYFPVQRIFQVLKSENVLMDNLKVSYMTERAGIEGFPQFYRFPLSAIQLRRREPQLESCRCEGSRSLFLYFREMPENLVSSASKWPSRKRSMELLVPGKELIEKCYVELAKTCSVTRAIEPDDSGKWAVFGFNK